ncbi:hypothetical protein CDL12_27273 [Handroanthus impetiginosus]|uniref:Uncharacterized protein n=1 Tax=Handroanthus impetiginosus TaxID=429701 RepID=A0A2G9G507_9LAMI|nr:hypothetical protein CDL12_27273 [Handroanthus impetiginosus]
MKPSLEETLTQFMASTTTTFNKLQEITKEPAIAKGKDVSFAEKEKELEAPLARLQKYKLEKQFQKFLEVSKNLYIYIPFAETFEQMPTYAKFMKDTLSKKRRLDDYEMVTLIEECSAIIQKKSSSKLKDTTSVKTSCKISTHFLRRALCDLGAGINLMPHSIYCTLSLGKAEPISITLQLANTSLIYPRAIIDDIFVEIYKFIFIVDFIVVNKEADSEITITFGIALLATDIKFSNKIDEYFSVSVLDSNAGKNPLMEQAANLLKRELLNFVDEEEEEEGQKVVKLLDSSKDKKSKEVEYLEKLTLSKVLKPSIEEPSMLELKPLPSHLCYVFLGDLDTLYVIIVSLLLTFLGLAIFSVYQKKG